ncbi:MAG: NAD/NADP octopine/nopaline dehydrogenase family protein [Candidatus Margulisbacteria bacterium]|nr:NAD/NADP octopine/nopaline dehydrogenase family protein [Candidatus Margulisiibacteriota bacterium]MBU1729585.1 NAD/NADP octopine/nopaline dehydrogenase family protein [Candidatus Margulisiibacteriota bacterium]MBU1956010.1 NAD/NADP octopine/nopaline dehydrogenase family protein [Candidatus Margulisiibacteriota bacterium]
MAKVTILGAGNAGQTAAYHFSSKGHEVCLYEHPNFAKALDAIEANGNMIEALGEFKKGDIVIKGLIPGKAKIAKISKDIKEAMDFADTIIMPVPAFAQANIFQQVMPYLRDGHMLITLPGNESSFIFAKMMREAGIQKNVLFCEGASIPYACRIVGPAKVFIGGLKEAFEFGCFPANRTEEAVKRAKEVLPLNLDVKSNVIEVHFYNFNMIVHPSTACLNMGAFESRNGEFYFYKEGMSPSTSKVQQKMDNERIAIGEKLGFKNIMTFVEAINLWYGLKVKSIREFAETTPIHNAFGHDAPKSPKERYISEDTPYVLVPMHEYGKLVGLSHPAIESIINISDIYNDVDYFTEGRTFEKMGIASLSAKEILAYADTGILKAKKKTKLVKKDAKARPQLNA